MLKKLTDWLREQIVAIWDAFTEFMGDLFLDWVERSLAIIVWVLDHLPVPDFLQGQSIGSVLGNAGPTVAWMITTFRIGESLTVIGSAMAFYIIRRFLTLGIW